MKSAWPVGWVLGLSLLLAKPAAAAMQMSFSALPGGVEADNEFSVNLSLADAPKARKYYLRAALFEPGKTSYFGYTLNHLGQWHNQPAEFGKFLEIATNDQGSWSGQLKARADLSSGYFKGGGEYQFKVGRYTEGGSLSWSDNEGVILINYAAAANPSPAAESGNSNPSPNPSPADASPAPSESTIPSPLPSRAARIQAIHLLNPESPEPVLGTQSSNIVTSKPRADWGLAASLLLTGAGLVLLTAFIIIRLWRKS